MRVEALKGSPLDRKRPTVGDTLACGHVLGIAETRGIGTGYATTPGGAYVCYPCADVAQRVQLAEAQPGAEFFAYVSDDGKRLTTWTGGRLGLVRIGKRHPWSTERFYIQVIDVHGGEWYGVGAPGMYATLRKAKGGR